MDIIGDHVVVWKYHLSNIFLFMGIFNWKKMLVCEMDQFIYIFLLPNEYTYYLLAESETYVNN